ncbi:MAG: glycosyltransferase [Candidatus Heimdallarchaeota archaeon]
MPAYNEGHAIEETIDRVNRAARQAGLEYELIVVDDGSVDETRRKAVGKLITIVTQANNNSHVKIIGYGKNMGKGHAVKTGFAYATGDAVIFVDSDLDVDPEQVTRYVKALDYGDVVIGSKWHPQSSVQIPLIRKLLSHGFNVLVRLLTGLRLRDTQTGIKAIRRSALEGVFSRLAVKRYAFDVELLMMAKLCGLKIVELPVNLRMRSSFDLKEVWRIFVDLLGIAYRLRVLKYYQCPVVSKATRIGLKD